MTRARQLEELQLAGEDRALELRDRQVHRAARAGEVARVNTRSQFDRRLRKQAVKEERRTEYLLQLRVVEKKRRKALVDTLEKKDDVYDRYAQRLRQ